jgi:hypothetical protein
MICHFPILGEFSTKVSVNLDLSMVALCGATKSLQPQPEPYLISPSGKVLICIGQPKTGEPALKLHKNIKLPHQEHTAAQQRQNSRSSPILAAARSPSQDLSLTKHRNPADIDAVAPSLQECGFLI